MLLMDYLSNPNNIPLSRNALGKKVLGYAKGETIYLHFTPAELSIIENEALILRRTKYAVPLMKVDRGILKEGAAGVPGAAKLCYQRFEDWSPVQKVEGKLTFESVLNDMIDVTPAADSQAPGQITDGGGDSVDNGNSDEIVED